MSAGGARARILAVLPDHPFPLDMGSRVRNLRILESLARVFDLSVITLVHDAARMRDPGPVAGLGRWTGILAPHRRGRLPWIRWHLQARWEAAAHGIHGETFFQSLPALAGAVAERVEQDPPDLVHVAYWYTLRRLAAFPRPPLWVVDTHDVQFERHEQVLGHPSRREGRREIRELARYDHVIAITERDRGVFLRHLGSQAPPVEVIGMGLDLEAWRRDEVEPALPPAPRVAFYGNLRTSPNQEGLRHLLRTVIPSLREAVPGLEILVIGAHPPAALREEAAATGARVTGFVADVRPWLCSARVLALSLRSGSGQRSRVVEALALGVPVVGYEGALDGLDLAEGEGIVTVRSPEALRDALARLLNEPGRAEDLARAGRSRIEARYGCDATYGLFPERYRSWLERARSGGGKQEGPADGRGPSGSATLSPSRGPRFC